MKENSLISGGNQEKFTAFAKNTAHKATRLRKNAYLCSRNKLIGYEVR